MNSADDKKTSYSKRFYRLSEVSAMLGLPPSTINYWVTVFDELDPPVTKGGHRRYRPCDVELIKRIDLLMHTKAMSIEGARRQLRLSTPPARGYRCSNTDEALELLARAGKMISDNPRAVAVLDAVAAWLRTTQER